MSFPKTELEALDRIQNKELFIILYTKPVHLKKKIEIQLCWPPEEVKSFSGSIKGARKLFSHQAPGHRNKAHSSRAIHVAPSLAL